jgi:hypothetical protein
MPTSMAVERIQLRNVIRMVQAANSLLILLGLRAARRVQRPLVIAPTAVWASVANLSRRRLLMQRCQVDDRSFARDLAIAQLEYRQLFDRYRNLTTRCR